MKLKALNGNFSILQLPKNSPIPDWVQEGDFFAMVRTDDELSIVCDSSVVPSDVEKVERGWKCLKVMGPLNFSLTGILSSIANPLADASISIFAISTYNTDYILIPKAKWELAIDVLKHKQFEVFQVDSTSGSNPSNE